MTIKLFLFFIAMDLLTLMAYPIVFLHGKLRWLSKEIEHSRPSQMDFKKHR